MDTTVCTSLNRGATQQSGLFQEGVLNKNYPSSRGKGNLNPDKGVKVVPSGIPKYNAISIKRPQQYPCNPDSQKPAHTSQQSTQNYECSQSMAHPRFETYMMTGDLILNIDPPGLFAPNTTSKTTTQLYDQNAKTDYQNQKDDKVQGDFAAVEGVLTLSIDDNDRDTITRFVNGYDDFGSGDTYIYPQNGHADQDNKPIASNEALQSEAYEVRETPGTEWAPISRSPPSSPTMGHRIDKRSALDRDFNLKSYLVPQSEDVKMHNVSMTESSSKAKLAALRENMEKHRLRNRLQLIANTSPPMEIDNIRVINTPNTNSNGFARSKINDERCPLTLTFGENDKSLMPSIYTSQSQDVKINQKIESKVLLPCDSNVTSNCDSSHSEQYMGSVPAIVGDFGKFNNGARGDFLITKQHQRSGHRHKVPNEHSKVSFDEYRTVGHGYKSEVNKGDALNGDNRSFHFSSLAAENNVSASCQTLCLGYEGIPDTITQPIDTISSEPCLPNESNSSPRSLNKTPSAIMKEKGINPSPKRFYNKGQTAYRSARYERKITSPQPSSACQVEPLENRLLWTVNNNRDMEMIAAAAAASTAFSSHYDKHIIDGDGPEESAPSPASLNFIRNEEQKRTSDRLLKIERRRRLVETNRLKKLQEQQEATELLPPPARSSLKASGAFSDDALNHYHDKGIEEKSSPKKVDSYESASTLSELILPITDPSQQHLKNSPTHAIKVSSSGTCLISSASSSPSSSSISSSSATAVVLNQNSEVEQQIGDRSLIVSSYDPASKAYNGSDPPEYYIIEKQAAERFLTVIDSSTAAKRLASKATGLLSQTDAPFLSTSPTSDKRIRDVLSSTSPFYGTEAGEFLKRLFYLDGIDKVQVAQFLNYMTDTNERLTEEFFNEFFFEKVPLDVALRNFFLHVSLVGENCDREKTLKIFSKYYYQFNPSSFISEDALHILVCALVLLNTDFYLCDIGKKMSCKEFITNLTSMGNYAKSYDKSYLKKMYYSIKEKPLQGKISTDSVRSRPSDCRSFVEQNPYLAVPPPYLNENIVVKQGFLRRKCFQDANGRKSSFVRRNWKTFFAVLRGRVLYLNKGSDVSENSLGNDYNSIRLHHALALKSSEYIRKPFVFQLQTADWAIYFFQAGNLQDMENWIESINLIAATFSALSLPSPVSFQKKFHRPLLPSLPTKHNMIEQLAQHNNMVKELEKEIELLRDNPPAPQWKSREIVEFKEKENYYLYELKRYKTYTIHLQRKLSQKDYKSLRDPLSIKGDTEKLKRIGEPMKNFAPSNPSTSVEESVSIISSNHTPLKANSDRYSYKAAIYKSETERNYF